MAGAFIELDDAEALAALNRLLELGQRPRPALLEIGEALLQSTEQRFRDQRDPDGLPWAPLSPAYLASKKKRAGRQPEMILVLNGYLAGGIVTQASEDEVVVGTDRIYGATHQFGRSEQNIPARPFLGLSRDDRDEVLEILNEHLARAIGD